MLRGQRRIVMIGNCQVQALFNLYSRFHGPAANEDLTFIRSYEDISSTGAAALEAADVVVEQVQDFAPKAEIGGLLIQADRVAVPVLNCGFLWPYAGQPHPHNPSRPFLEGGPYGAEASDRYLNGLIRKGVTTEDAVDAYIEVDVNKAISLDRMLEIGLEKQQSRDRLAGFRIAPIVEEYFRREPVFLTPYHPNRRIAVEYATQFFQKMKVEPADIRRMQRTIRVTPFPKEELPIHPAVQKHFGLAYGGANHRYRFLQEGFFTFREYAIRYLKCTWNEALAEGLERARGGDLNAARDLLWLGLQSSPLSAAGFGALAHVYDRQGLTDDAINAAQTALKLDPAQASYHANLAMLGAKRDENDLAEQELRIALALDPGEPHYAGLLSGLLRRIGEPREAALIAEYGLERSPYAANLHMDLGHSLEQLGDLEGAAASFGRATGYPGHASAAWSCLSTVRERQGQNDEALTALEHASKLEPDRAEYLARRARLLVASGRSEEAVAVWNDVSASNRDSPRTFRDAIHALISNRQLEFAEAMARRATEQFPDDAHLHSQLGYILRERGRPDASLAALREAIRLEPSTASFHIQLGDTMLRVPDLPGAEAAFREAIALAPGDAHPLGQLGYVLSTLNRHDEAIEARRKAVALQPSNPHRFAQLGHVQLQAGLLDEAEECIRQAIAMSPRLAPFHLDLSNVLSRAGRLEEAVQSARESIDLQPDSPRNHLQLAELLVRVGQHREAADAYHDVLRLEPGNEHAQRRAASLVGHGEQVSVKPKEDLWAPAPARVA